MIHFIYCAQWLVGGPGSMLVISRPPQINLHCQSHKQLTQPFLALLVLPGAECVIHQQMETLQWWPPTRYWAAV